MRQNLEMYPATLTLEILGLFVAIFKIEPLELTWDRHCSPPWESALIHCRRVAPLAPLAQMYGHFPRGASPGSLRDGPGTPSRASLDLPPARLAGSFTGTSPARLAGGLVSPSPAHLPGGLISASPAYLAGGLVSASPACLAGGLARCLCLLNSAKGLPYLP